MCSKIQKPALFCLAAFFCFALTSCKDSDSVSKKDAAVARGVAQGESGQGIDNSSGVIVDSWKVLMIATDRYDEWRIPNLRCAVRDLDAFRQSLIDCGVPEGNIVEVKTGGAREPRKVEIERAVDEFVKGIEEGDLALVYMTGHGLQPKGSGVQVYAPADLDLKDMLGTGVSIKGIMEKVNGTRAKAKLMFVDACRETVSASEKSSAAFAENSTELDHFVLSPTGSVIVLQSCRNTEFSYESASLGHGYFTQGLLEAFVRDDNPADTNGDGVATIFELADYVSESVRYISDGRQSPTLSGKTNAIVLLTGLTSGGVSRADREKAEKLFAEAEVLYEDGDLESASEKIDGALAIRSVRKYDDLKRWIERDSGDAQGETAYQKALELEEEGRLSEALDVVVEAVQQSPRNGLYVQLKNDLQDQVNGGEEEYRAGQRTLFGLNRSKIDRKEAFRLLTEASEKGHILAKGLLARMCLDGGADFKHDYARAYELASDPEVARSSGAAMEVLEYAYRYGCGVVEPDEQKADEYRRLTVKEYERLAMHGDVAAMCRAGLLRFGGFFGSSNDVAGTWNELKSSAEQGCVAAMTQAACCLADGIGTQADPDEAFRLFSEAAELGDSGAMVMLGYCSLNGQGTDQDPEKAVEWFAKSAELGDNDGRLWLAECFINGIGVKEDPDRAFQILRSAEEERDPKGLSKLSSLYFDGIGTDRDAEKGLELLEKAAEYGNPDAILGMGIRLYEGKGVDQNVQEGFKWFMKADAAGYASGSLWVGNCYRDGIGAERDVTKALTYYRKAFNGGQYAAATIIGDMYFERNILQFDASKAVEWYRKGADKGSFGSLYNLGYCYEEGIGVGYDYAEAMDLYRQAADLGSVKAYLRMAEMYFSGLGVDKDPEEAVRLGRRAAELGDDEGMCSMGVVYRDGITVEPDPKQAAEWFLKSAERGNARAMLYLAECCETGSGVPQDSAKAEEWRQKAREAGYEPDEEEAEEKEE